MSTLPEAALGSEGELAPRGWWMRARRLAGARMSYALADQVVYSFGNMVVAALISRHCTQGQFGTYVLTQRVMDVLIQLSNVFLWAPFTYNLPGTEKPRQRVYLGSIVAQQGMACVLAAMLLWGSGTWAAAKGSSLYFGVFAPLAVTSIGILFREFTRRMYFAELRLKAAFWTDVATVVLQVVGVEWLYYKHRLDVPRTLWMLSAGAIVVSLYWVVTEWPTFVVRVSEIANDMRRNLHLGGWLLGGNMIYTVSSQANPWVVSALLGAASYGAYNKCEMVVNVPRVALNSLQNTMAPLMARAVNDGGKPALRKVVARFDRILLLGSVLFAVGIVAFGPWLAGAVFKAPPANARTILVLLSLNFVAFAATMAQSYALTAMDKPGLAFYSYLIGLVFQLGVTVWMVRAFQLPGAAAAMLVGSVAVLAARQWFYAREMREA